MLLSFVSKLSQAGKKAFPTIIVTLFTNLDQIFDTTAYFSSNPLVLFFANQLIAIYTWAITQPKSMS
jgi:hypothetical protein